MAPQKTILPATGMSGSMKQAIVATTTKIGAIFIHLRNLPCLLGLWESMNPETSGSKTASHRRATRKIALATTEEMPTTSV